MDWIPIVIAILETLQPLLADCLEPGPEGVANLRRFGPAMQFHVFRGAKQLADKDGCTARESRRRGILAVRQAKEDIEASSDAELISFIQDLHAL